MVIKMVHALVAEFAVHRFFSHLDVADPALFRRSVGVPSVAAAMMCAAAAAAAAAVVYSVGTGCRGKQTRVRRINPRCHVAKVGGSPRKATEYQGARDGGCQGKQRRCKEKKLHDEGGKEDPSG